jgi:palmitoyl-protein thioesterase
MLFVVAIVVSIAHIFAVSGSPPVVLWHGMGDSCCNPLSLGKIIKLIERELTPSPYVHSIRIGNNIEEDTANSFFMNVNHQIDYACKLLQADKNLTQGYHAIGYDNKFYIKILNCCFFFCVKDFLKVDNFFVLLLNVVLVRQCLI